MAMNVGPGPGEEDEVVSTINTTPLVDVMLVLLIIFLITIPVVTHTIPVALPKETDQPSVVKPKDVTIAVNRDGDIFVDQVKVPDMASLLSRMRTVAAEVPQPAVHIRGDMEARYKSVGEVVITLQQAGIVKVGFIIEPPPRG